jgi:hypothetical protein
VDFAGQDGPVNWDSMPEKVMHESVHLKVCFPLPLFIGWQDKTASLKALSVGCVCVPYKEEKTCC